MRRRILVVYINRITFLLSVVIISSCIGETDTNTDPDRIYSNSVSTSEFGFVINATVSDNAKFAWLFLNMQPSKVCVQSTGQSVLLSAGDRLSAYRSGQSTPLSISPPLPGSTAKAYQLSDLSPETPGSWGIRFTRDSEQTAFDSTVNIIALPELEVPKNGTAHKPEDVLTFSWSPMLYTEDSTSTIAVDEIRVRLTGDENAVVHRISISDYLQDPEVAFMEIPVADITNLLGKTELPIELDYALSISSASNPEIVVSNGLSKKINEALARECETGKGDLIVSQSWRSITVTATGFVEL